MQIPRRWDLAHPHLTLCSLTSPSGGRLSLLFRLAARHVGLVQVEGVGRLRRGVELLSVAPLLARAIGRAFAASERHMVVDPRCRQIDHHHPGLTVALKMRGVFQAGGADPGREAKLGVVRNLKRLLIVPSPDYA